MSSGVKSSEPEVKEDVGAFETPPMIHGYRFVRILGRGGMGVVWEAIQLGTARNVAVKFMGAALMGETARKRFAREVKLAARLTHPGIVRVYDSGLHRNDYYYVMELVDGVPLDQAARAGGYSPERIVRLIARVCEAADYAHKQGVVHRDLKPGNILVSGDGSPHILDFGLAKECLGAAGPGAEDFLVSSEGDRTGTPIYMSPEQAAGKIAVTPASDVYSIGAICYHLLSGRYAHDPHLPRTELYRRIATEPAPRLGQVAKGLPVALEKVIAKAMAVESRERFGSAGEMGEALLRCFGGAEADFSGAETVRDGARNSPSPQPTPEGRGGNARKAAVIGVAALLVLILMGVGAWKVFGSGEIRTPEQELAATGVRLVAVTGVTSGVGVGADASGQLGGLVREQLAQRLGKVGEIKVVGPKRYDEVLGQHKGSAAKALGLSVLVEPTLEEVVTKSQTFSGYGVATKRSTTTARLTVRIGDAKTSTVKYSQTFKGEAVRESSTFSRETEGGADAEAVRDAVGKACADTELVNAIMK